MDKIEIVTQPAAFSVERVDSLTVIELSPKEVRRLHLYLQRLARTATCAKPCQRGNDPLSGEDEDGECYCFASLP
jgi:hypothetical protein